MVWRFTPDDSPSEIGVDYKRDLIAGLTYELVPLKSVETAITALPVASKVSVTCSPVKGIDATVELTDHIRALGHHAVPHLSARLVEGPEHVARLAHWLRTEEIGQIFLVGGDADRPVGPYGDAMAFLRALLDADPGLSTVGVAAYPDGHPLIEADVLHKALHVKQELLAEAGVAGYATTQMCFDAARIDRWLQRQRNSGLTLPIHLGVAGVVDRAKLLTMGVRLGIGASLRYLRKNRGALGQLLSSGDYDPAKLLDPLSPILESAGVEGIHCFTFNQVAATVAWQERALEQL